MIDANSEMTATPDHALHQNAPPSLNLGSFGDATRNAMNLRFVLLIVIASLSTSVLAASHAPRSDQELVHDSRWIFSGRILRAQSFRPQWAGEVDEQYSVEVERVLRGNPPKTVVVRGNASRPADAGQVFIFFTSREQPAPGFGLDAILARRGIYPLTKVKEIEDLIEKETQAK